MSGSAAPWSERLTGAERAMERDGIESIRIDAPRWLELAGAARDAGFARFIDLTAIDEPQRPERFDVVLTVYSMEEHRWLRLRTRTAGSLASLTAMFLAADWYEREVFDLFGVQFAGHPRLTRILLPDDFPSHPLRRDHPLGDEPVEFLATREVEE
jgi:NADH-quinone oxidoreductase subunit C